MIGPTPLQPRSSVPPFVIVTVPLVAPKPPGPQACTVPPEMLGGLLGHIGLTLRAGRGIGDAVPLARFSQREIDVVTLVSEGIGTREIAQKLSYSERTVKNVLQGIMLRLGLRNRAHAQQIEALRKLLLKARRTENGKHHGSGRPLLASEGESELRLVRGHADAAVARADDVTEIVVGHGALSGL